MKTVNSLSGGKTTMYDKIVPVYEEDQLFKMIGVDYVEPEKRNL